MKLQNTLWQANTTEANLESKLVQVALAHSEHTANLTTSSTLNLHLDIQKGSDRVREPNPAERPRQAVHVLDTPSAASSTAEWSSHLQTPQAWKSTGSKAQPWLYNFISLNSRTSGKSNINDQIYVIFMFYIVLYVCFETSFHMRPDHITPWIYIYIHNYIYIYTYGSTGFVWSPISFEVVEERFAINLLRESGPQFAWFQADPWWFHVISTYFWCVSALPYPAVRIL